MSDYEAITIFLSHGRSTLWKDVARFVERELDFEVVVLQEQTNQGRTIIEKLEEVTEDCHFAIIIMTAEDEQADGNVRARQNIVHEIGFCQGTFGRQNVLVLRQNGIEDFSNLSGIVYESFEGDNIKSTFEKIRQELEEFEADWEAEES